MPIRITEHNSGIYIRRNVKIDGAELGPWFKEWAQNWNEALNGWLDAAEAEARNVLNQSDDIPAECSSEAQVERWLEIQANRKASARKLRNNCMVARHHIERGNAWHAAFFAFHAGQNIEQMWIASHEHHAARGRKTLDAAGKGSAKTHGTASQRQRDYDDWQRTLALKMATNPRLSLSEARRRIAEQACVHPKTVERHTRRPTEHEIKTAKK